MSVLANLLVHGTCLDEYFVSQIASQCQQIQSKAYVDPTVNIHNPLTALRNFRKT